jgi:hypothetical protein
MYEGLAEKDNGVEFFLLLLENFKNLCVHYKHGPGFGYRKTPGIELIWIRKTGDEPRKKNVLDSQRGKAVDGWLASCLAMLEKMSPSIRISTARACVYRNPALGFVRDL